MFFGSPSLFFVCFVAPRFFDQNHLEGREGTPPPKTLKCDTFQNLPLLGGEVALPPPPLAHQLVFGWRGVRGDPLSVLRLCVYLSWSVGGLSAPSSLALLLSVFISGWSPPLFAFVFLFLFLWFRFYSCVCAWGWGLPLFLCASVLCLFCVCLSVFLAF